ncbi:MAG: GGDEF domain-containing protein [Patescibacteria group bacterium]
MDDDAPRLETEGQIKKLEDEIERLRHLVYFDELTGVLNRRGFLHGADAEFRLVSSGTSTIERRVGVQIPFAIVFCDLDNFKELNDTHGHAVGDEALKLCAQIFSHSLRQGDMIGRWGGEEFVIALAGVGATNAERIAEKLRANLEKAQLVWEGVHIAMSGSFGVALCHNGDTLHDIIARADRAMYEAKKSGKNRVVVSPER